MITRLSTLTALLKWIREERRGEYEVQVTDPHVRNPADEYLGAVALVAITRDHPGMGMPVEITETHIVAGSVEHVADYAIAAIVPEINRSAA